MRKCLRLPVFVLCLVLPAYSIVFGSPELMKGPDAERRRNVAPAEPETSASRLVLLGMLTLFQKYVSPIDGDRCGFEPSCSAFAREALGRGGAAEGVIATADRLMRCTPFKAPGADYLPLASGKLFDPVENNLLSNP